MNPEEERQQRHGQGELVKFMVLVGILLLAVLVVAASRPLIFDWIIPTALGWEPTAPAMDSEPLPAAYPAPAGFPLPAGSPPPVGYPPPAASPAGQDVAPLPAPTVTALPEPTATPQSYQVQAGDTLTAIAGRFGVTVEALLAANAIDNPHRIMPGDVLIIPAP